MIEFLKNLMAAFTEFNEAIKPLDTQTPQQIKDDWIESTVTGESEDYLKETCAVM